MSRAFVKESDGEPAASELPERPVSRHPNFVTPRGLKQIKARIKALEEERSELGERPEDLAARGHLPLVERDLRYFRQRLRDAIEVRPETLTGDKVQFGSTVEIEASDGRRSRYRIVGEDEADVANGSISWVSPLAAALMGHELDDEVEWRRPSGTLTVSIIEISSDAEP